MIKTFELDIKLGLRNHQVMPFLNRIVITNIFIICLCVTPTVNATSISELKQARNAYDNGDYSAALYYLHQILKTKPNDVRILTAIGSTFNELGNYSGAISFYKKALEIDPHHVGALTGIGATLDLLGICKDTSVTYFKEALAEPVSPNDSVGKLERTLAFTHLKNYTQAMSVVDQVLKAHPTYTDALNAKGVIMLYQNNATGALSLFNRILTVRPNVPAALDNEGITFAKLHDYPQALKYLDRSIAINSGDADGWYNKGYVLDRMYNFTGALRAYNAAMKLTPITQI